MLKITWIGHSCFKLEKDGYTIITDPYADGSVPGYTPVHEKADMVLCSHEHADHNFRDGVELIERPGLKPGIVIPMHYRSMKYNFGYDVIGTVDEFTEIILWIMLRHYP